MQVDSISRLLQLNQLQAISGDSTDTSAAGTSSDFSALLQEMLSSVQSTSAQGSSDSSSSNTSTVKGVQDLSLDPQKLAQMLQLQSMKSMFASASAGDTDSTSGDDVSDDYIMGVQDTSSDMSQMYDYMLQAMSQNNGTDSTNASSVNTSSILESLK